MYTHRNNYGHANRYNYMSLTTDFSEWNMLPKTFLLLFMSLNFELMPLIYQVFCGQAGYTQNHMILNV